MNLNNPPRSILETERLMLRPARESDIVVLHDLIFGDTEVMRFLFRGLPMTPEESETAIRTHFTFGSQTGYAVLCDRSEKVVGYAGIAPCGVLGDDDLEIGFVLGRAFWGQGYAQEIGAAQLAFGFETLNCRRMLGLAHADNAASIAALSKIGMRHLRMSRLRIARRAASFRFRVIVGSRKPIRPDWLDPRRNTGHNPPVPRCAGEPRAANIAAMIRAKATRTTTRRKASAEAAPKLPNGVIAFAPPSFKRERALMKRGVGPVAGCDEVGRGPLAGPVVAAAVILDPKRIPKGLDDSKRLTAEKREALFEKICATSSFAVAFASPARIDRDNILRASLWALSRAVHALPAQPQHVLVDGRDKIITPEACGCDAVIGGDGLVLSIAAASIVAKVTRDRLMRQLAQECPGYGFENHKGYGVPEHLDALDRLGPTRHHRSLFAPVVAARLRREGLPADPQLALQIHASAQA